MPKNDVLYLAAEIMGVVLSYIDIPDDRQREIILAIAIRLKEEEKINLELEEGLDGSKINA